jgi:hypothetical protein
MSPPTVDNAGLGEPLLANGKGATALANGTRHGDAGAVPTLRRKKKGSKEETYWVDIDQPDVLESAPDLENGSGGRPLLLFRNKKVKRRILYPYRCVYIKLFTMLSEEQKKKYSCSDSRVHSKSLRYLYFYIYNWICKLQV